MAVSEVKCGVFTVDDLSGGTDDEIASRTSRDNIEQLYRGWVQTFPERARDMEYQVVRLYFRLFGA